MSTTRMFLPLFIVLMTCFSSAVNSTQFQVGGEKDWTIPNVRQDQDRDFYNEWASDHRFKINDTLRFKYEKDSVLVVTEEEYHKCKASHPIFFSNNEDTVFTLDRSGLYYFISGVAGHCERGQKMIIKVLEEQQQEQQEAGKTAPTPLSSVVPGASQNNQTNGAATSSAAVLAKSDKSAAVVLLVGVIVFL